VIGFKTTAPPETVKSVASNDATPLVVEVEFTPEIVAVHEE
jgi:hypothetical protein